jgi:hypothetical protein
MGISGRPKQNVGDGGMLRVARGKGGGRSGSTSTSTTTSLVGRGERVCDPGLIPTIPTSTSRSTSRCQAVRLLGVFERRVSGADGVSLSLGGRARSRPRPERVVSVMSCRVVCRIKSTMARARMAAERHTHFGRSKGFFRIGQVCQQREQKYPL